METGTRNAATTEAGMTNRLKLSFLRLLAQHRELSPLIILVALCIAFSMGNASFFSALNLTNLLSILPELGIIALAMTLLLTTGEFDLSVGAVFALAPILLLLMVQLGVPLPVALALALAVSAAIGCLNAWLGTRGAVALGLAVSAAIGCLNGWLVTGMAIPSFLVTLSMLLIVRGVALFITNGFPQKPLEDESWLRWMLSGGVDIGEFTIHAWLLWFIALTVMCHYLLRRSKLGNWILATGSNGPAAIARGVPTAKV